MRGKETRDPNKQLNWLISMQKKGSLVGSGEVGGAIEIYALSMLIGLFHIVMNAIAYEQ